MVAPLPQRPWIRPAAPRVPPVRHFRLPVPKTTPANEWWTRKFQPRVTAPYVGRLVGSGLIGLTTALDPTPAGVGSTLSDEEWQDVVRNAMPALDPNALPPSFDFETLPQRFVQPDTHWVPLVPREVPLIEPMAVPDIWVVPDARPLPVRRRADEAVPWQQVQHVGPETYYRFSVSVRGNVPGIRGSWHPARTGGKSRRDRKSRQGMAYLAALGFVNRFWGPVSELLDTYEAFVWNATSRGKPLAFLSVQQQIAAIRNGDLEVDWDGFVKSFLLQQASDWIIARGGKAAEKGTRPFMGEFLGIQGRML